MTRRQQATLAWLRYLRRVPCADCGGSFAPYVMDFDHRNPKTKSFSLGSSRAMLKSREQLLAEIAKCNIVCVNCHRARTYAAFITGALRPPSFVRRAEAGSREQRRVREKWHRAWTAQTALLRAMRERPCLDCDKAFPWFVMEFDHRDPSQKTAFVTQMAGRVTLGRLLQEVAKCDIVCASCHRVRTYVRRETTGDQRGCVVMAASKASILEVRVRFPPPAQNL